MISRQKYHKIPDMKDKKILLHICCAPCSIEVIEKLSHNGYLIYGYFYNPNIYPFEEYIKRRDSVVKYLKKLNFEFKIGDYDSVSYAKSVSNKFAGNNRCIECYKFRLINSAETATELNFKNFSTTLLFNPHKDFKCIAKLAGQIARENGLNFINPVLKRDYWGSKEKAKSEGVYFQKYCGCIFSIN